MAIILTTKFENKNVTIMPIITIGVYMIKTLFNIILAFFKFFFPFNAETLGNKTEDNAVDMSKTPE